MVLSEHKQINSVYMGIALVLAMAFSLPVFAQQGPSTLNVSGGLFLPSGLPVTSANVNFKLEIWDKDSTCLLYTEDHLAQNLSASKGGFALAVGRGSNISNLVEASSTLSARIFENNGVIAGGWTNCPSGATLLPGDERVIRVYYNLGAGYIAMSPDVPIASAAYAMVAESLQGRRPTDFIQVRSDATYTLDQANVENVFSNTNYARLQQLLNPTAAVPFAGQRLSNIATPTAAQDAATKGYTDGNLAGQLIDLVDVAPGSGGGKVLAWDQTANRWVATIQTTIDNTKLPLAGGTMTGAINMGGNNLNNVGNISMGTTRTLNLGTFDNTTEGALGLGATDVGKFWYNTQSGQLKVWNGTRAVPQAFLDAGGKLDAGWIPDTTVTGAAYGSATQVPTFTVGADGRLTAAANVTISGVAPGGAAGGDLTGTYPNPSVANLAIGTSKLADNAVTSAKINSTGVATNRLLMTDGTTGATVTYANCPNNEILKFTTGTGWECATVASLSPITSVAGKTGAVTLNAADIVGLGTAAVRNIGVTPGDVPELDAGSRILASLIPLFGGDVTGAIGANVVTRLQGRDLSSAAPNTNDVLMWNGTAWAPTVLVDAGITALTGDVSASGSGSVVATLTNGVVTTPKMFANPGVNRLIATDGTTGATLAPFVCNLDEIMQWGASGWACRNVAIALGSQFIVDGGNARGAAISIGTSDNYNLFFETNNTTRMTILTSGFVGIGKTNPVNPLDVTGAISASGAISSGAAVSAITNVTAGGSISAGTNVNAVGNVSGANIYATTSMGVGTTSPARIFEVAGVMRVAPSALPGSPAAGDLAIDSGAGNSLKYHNGTNWISLTVGGAGDFLANGSVPMTGQFRSTAGTAAAPGVTFVGDTDNGVFAPAADNLAFGTAANERMRILANGNIGVGTSTPNRLLEVAGSIRITPTVLPGSPAAGDLAFDSSGNILKFHNGTSWQTVGTSSATGDFMANGTIPMTGNFRANGNWLSNDGGSEGLFVDAAGNVGVGTSSTARLFNVAGPIRISPAALPGSPAAGDLAFDSAASNTLKFYNGTAWQSVATGTGFALAGANADITSLNALTAINGASLTIGNSATTTLNVGGAATGALTATFGANTSTSTSTLQSGTGGTTITSTGIGTSAVNLQVNGVNGGIRLAPNGTGVVTSTTPIQITPTALPGSPTAGLVAIDSSASNTLKYHNGTAWVSVGSGSGDFMANGSVPMTGQFRSIAGTASAPGMTFVGDTDNGVFAPTADVLAFGTSASERMRILANGRVGIGTTNPTTALSVQGSANITSALGIGVTTPIYQLQIAGDMQFTGNIFGDSGQMLVSSTGRFLGATGSIAAPSYTFGGDLNTGLFRPSAGAIGFVGSGTERLRIDSSGNLGIGTTSPNRLLEVAGSIRITPTVLPGSPAAGDLAFDSSGNILKFHNGTSWQTVGTSSATGDFMANGTIPMTGNFRANGNWLSNDGGSEGLFVDSTGNVGVGTSSTARLFNVAGPIRIAPAALPGSPAAGDLAFDSAASNSLKFHNGTAWQTVGTSSGTGDFMANGSVPMTGPLLAISGSSTAPGISFSGDTDTGLYRSGADQISIVTNGWPQGSFSNDGFSVGPFVWGAFMSSGGTANSPSSPAYSFTSDTDTGIFRPTADNLAFGTAANERMRILANGNVGIGTTNPSSALDVNGVIVAKVGVFTNTGIPASSEAVATFAVSDAVNALLEVRNNSASDGVFVPRLSGRGTAGNPSLVIMAELLGDSVSNQGAMQFDSRVAPGGTIANRPLFEWTSNNSSRMIMDAGGRLGIGTTSPSRLLEVAGPVRISPAALPGSPGAGDVAIDSAASNTLKYHNGSTWVSIGSGSGDFLANGSVPMTGALRSIAGSAAAPGLSFVGDTDNGIFAPATDNLAFGTAANERVRILANGNVGIGTTAPSFHLAMGGAVNRTVGMERETGGASGKSLTVSSGSAASGGTNLNGGDLVFKSGVSTGSGNSGISFQVPLIGSPGTADNALITTLYTSTFGTLIGGRTSQTFGANLLRIADDDSGINSGSGIDFGGKYRVSPDTWGDYAKINGRKENNTNNNVAGYLSFETTVSGSGAPTEKMRINSAGNVGIGTTSPNRLLEVAGPIRITPTILPSSPAAGDLTFDSSGNALKFHNGTAWQTVGTSSANGDFLANGSLPMTGQFRSVAGTAAAPGMTFVGDTDNGMFAPAADNLAFGTSASEKMRILANGNVGIGTTSPTSRLDVRDTSTLTSGFIYGQNLLIGANPSAASTAQYNGLFAESRSSDNTNTSSAFLRGVLGQAGALTTSSNSTVGEAIGFESQTYAFRLGGAATATVTNAIGFQTRVITSAGGIVTNSAGFNAVVSSVPTNSTGMLISTNADSSIPTGNYALFSRSTHNSYFAGNVGIGTTGPNRLLEVAGPIRVAPTALPGSPAAGDIAIDSAASNTLKYHNGTAWVSLAGGGTGDFMANGSVAMTGALRSIAGSAAAPGLSFVGDTDNGIYSPASDAIAFTTSGAEKFRISSNGSVGIGTTASVYPLELVQNNNSFIPTAMFTNTNTGSNALASVGVNNGDSSVYVWATSSSSVFGRAGTILTGVGTPLHFGANGSPGNMRLDISGNLGIGVATNARRLHVAGPIRINPESLPGSPAAGDLAFDSSAGNSLKFHNGTSWQTVGTGSGGGDFLANGTIPMTGALRATNGTAAAPGLSFAGDTDNGIFAPAADNLAIGTSGAERLRILANGNVGIGLTLPTQPLDVAGSINIPGANYYRAGGIGILRSPGGATELRSNSGQGMSLIVDGATTAIAIGTSGKVTTNTDLAVGGNLDIGTGRIVNASSLYGISLDSVGRTTVTSATGGPILHTFSNTSVNPLGRVGFALQLNSTIGSQIEANQDGSSADVDLAFSTRGGNVLSERLRIKASGNVGIGTTLPNRLLEVAGPIRITPTILPSSPAAGDLAFDSSGNSLKFHNGTAWQTVASGSGFAASGANADITSLNALTAINGASLAIGNSATTTLNVGGAATGALTSTFGANTSTSTSTLQSGTGGTSITSLGIGTSAVNLQVNGVNGGIRLAPNGTGVVTSTRPIQITPTTLPAGPTAGLVAIDSAASNTLKYHNGSNWVSIGSGSGDFMANGSVPMTGAFRSIAGSETAPGFTFVGDTDNGIFAPAADNLAFGTSGSEKMRILANGNVGIGVTSPITTLDIAGSFALRRSGLNHGITFWGNSTDTALMTYSGGGANGGASIFGFSGASTRPGLELNGYSNSPNAGVASIVLSGAKKNGASIQPLSGTETVLKIENMPAFPLLTVLGSGNVGIGTISPNRLLEVAGPVRISPAALPGSPAAGDIAIDSGASNSLKYHNGTAWVSVAGGGTGDLMANGSVPMTGALRSIAGSAAAPGLSFVGDTDNGIFAPVADNLAISTSGAERLRVLANGYVGMGTTAPSANLHIEGSVPSTDAMIRLYNASNSVGANASILLQTTHTNADPFIRFQGNFSENFYMGVDTSDSGKFKIGSTSGGPAPGVDDTMTIDNAGRVGIGTTSPTRVLHLSGAMKINPTANPGTPTAGDIFVDSTASNTLKYHNGSAWVSLAAGGTGDFMANGSVNMTGTLKHLAGSAATPGLTFVGDTDNGIFAPSADVLAFGTSASEKMRILAGGNVGVGTTAPARLFHVFGPGDSKIQIEANDGGSASILMKNTQGDVGIGLGADEKFHIGGDGTLPTNAWMTIDTLGNVGIGTSTPATKLEVNGGLRSAFMALKGQDTAGTGGWYRIGTVQSSLVASTRFKISILGASGYSNNAEEYGETIIQGMIGGDNNAGEANVRAQFHHIGGGSPLVSAVKFIQGADRFTYDVRANFGSFSDHAYNVEVSDGMSWTENWSASSDPGANSATVRVAANQMTLPGASLGIGVATPTRLLQVAGAMKITPTPNPGTPTAGDIYVDSSASNTLTYHNGSTWISVGSGSGDFLSNGSLAMTGQFRSLAGSAAEPGMTFDGDTDNGIFRPAADNLAFSTLGAERMRILSNGTVGIGTTAPTSPLHVFSTGSLANTTEVRSDTNEVQLVLQRARDNAGAYESIADGDALANIVFRGHNGAGFATSARIGAVATDLFSTNRGTDLVFSTTADGTNVNPSERVRIMGDGKVGIGVPGPTRLLQVAGAIKINPTANPGTPTAGDIYVDSTASNALRYHNGSAWVSLTGGGGLPAADGTVGTPSINFTNSANMGFYRISNNVLGVSTASVNRMTVDASGNVGIGLTNPGLPLHVNGRSILGTNTTSGDTGGSSPSVIIGRNGAAQVSAMFLDAGNDLTVMGLTTNDYFAIATENTQAGIQFRTNGDWTGDMLNTATPRMTILNNGNVGIGMTNPSVALDVTGDIEYTGTITDVSDRRLKENIVPLDFGIDVLRQLPVYSYNMKGDAKKKTEYGVMAQDLQALVPNLTSIIDPKNGYIGVNYIGLIPWSIRAIQEVDREVASVKAENADLKTRVEKLEEQNKILAEQVQKLIEIHQKSGK